MRKRVFLFDGNSFCYRAFYAIKYMSTSDGIVTNAVYGFLTMFFKIVDDEKPDYCAVCFDSPGKKFRHADYEDYKANRKPMPGDLVPQMPVIKEFLECRGIKVFEIDGYEADDLLGTLAKCIEKKYDDIDIYIVTPDKDALQLVDEHISIYNLKKDKKVIYNIGNIRERLGGIGPEQVADLMALMGDSSDNIPGVPGIGEKTALSLILKYGSIEVLFDNLDKIKGAKRKNLEENRDKAFLSRKLAVIDCNVSLDCNLDDMKFSPFENAKTVGFYKKYEFMSFLRKIDYQATEGFDTADYILVKSADELKCLAKEFKNADILAFDTEATSPNPFDAEIVGVSFSVEKGKAYYVPLSHGGLVSKGIELEEAVPVIKNILENTGTRKCGQNMKYDLILLRKYGISPENLWFDTMIAAYLINPARLSQSLDDLSLKYLGLQKRTYASLCGKGKDEKRIDEVELSLVKDYACEDADAVIRLVEIFMPLLKEQELDKLFFKVEMPLVSVLVDMEWNGIKIDESKLKKLSDVVSSEIDALSEKIYDAAGEKFNINSPKQLSYILFEKLKLPVKKRTKTGYSTNVNVLEELANEHEVPEYVLRHRELTKLKSTYLDALPSLINRKTRLIHPSFNQTMTVTGRLSSSSPNVQNIPVRTALGRKVREAFIPREKGRKIVSADYSQIELRFLAHFSEDKTLLNAFLEGKDIHTVTAAVIYGIDESEVTPDMRGKGKVVNFSIIYGKTPFGLSKDLGISINAAKSFIDEYFKRYSGIREYLEGVKEEARKNGYVKTILGRRIYLPDINSANSFARQFAERAATNAPLQGSSADLIKKAMVNLSRDIKEKKKDAYMIMQVHDELVFDVDENDLDGLLGMIEDNMKNAIKLKLPLDVSMNVGDTWFK